MPKTVDNYLIKQQLFKDRFQVQYFSCQHKVLKKIFTLKKIHKPLDRCNSKQEENRNFKLSFLYTCLENEIQISREFKSEKIIKCLKILKAKNSVYAVYDEHPEKTLQKMIEAENLTSEKKQSILNEVLFIVRELHDHNVALGNLSPGTLFVTEDFKLQLSNFLIAKNVNIKEAKINPLFLDKNLNFYAPELISKGSLSKAADIYSLGQIVKSLNLQKSDHEFLSPVRFAYENIKDLVEKMIDENPTNRPSIEEIQKHFNLKKSRNKSTCGSCASRDNEENQNDIKGFQSYKSQATLRFCNEKFQPKAQTPNESKKFLLSKRQSMNEDLMLKSPKRTNLKSRQTLYTDSPLSDSPLFNFEATVVKKFKQPQYQRNTKFSTLTNKIDLNVSTSSQKHIFKEISLLRNLVSFLIEMVLFVSEEGHSKELCFYLVLQALHFTNNLLKILDALVKEGENTCKKLSQLMQEFQKEKRKLVEISVFFNKQSEPKVYYEIDLIEELKKFGKYTLNTCMSDISNQKNVSQVSETSFKSKYVQANQSKKIKENEQKLFKSYMLLKRLEYGNYLDFFRAKIHHSNKKFWNEHYFEFEKTFGGKYFAIQIKELINRK